MNFDMIFNWNLEHGLLNSLWNCSLGSVVWALLQAPLENPTPWLAHSGGSSTAFGTKDYSVFRRVMLGLQQTPEGLGTDLQPKHGQTCGYLGVGGQDCMFLQCYSPEGHKLLLNTLNNSTHHWNRQAPWPLLTIKNGCGTCQFHLRVTQLAAESSFGRKSLQVGHNLFDGLVCHSARL